jgi:hypothetical protein
VAIPHPAVSEAVQGVAEVRAASSQPVVLLPEGPPAQEAAVREQEGRPCEDMVAMSAPIVAAA